VFFLNIDVGDSPSRQSAWKEVSLFGVARFDCVGEEGSRTLSVRRGDGLTVSKEAKGELKNRSCGLKK
jgi:hypothetical protein